MYYNIQVFLNNISNRSGNGKEPNVEHISDITSCTATGLFDPFTLNWSPIMKRIFGIEVKFYISSLLNNLMY